MEKITQPLGQEHWKCGLEHSKMMSPGRRTQECDVRKEQEQEWNYTLDRDIKGGI